jgi:hypothetical protein
MKTILLATFALAITPSLAFGIEPAKHAQQQSTSTSNGTRQQSANQYHDRSPVVRDRSTVSPR